MTIYNNLTITSNEIGDNRSYIVLSSKESANSVKITDEQYAMIMKLSFDIEEVLSETDIDEDTECRLVESLKLIANESDVNTNNGTLFINEERFDFLIEAESGKTFETIEEEFS